MAVADGTIAGLPLREEPEDDQPAPSLRSVHEETVRGSHAGPAPAFADLADPLSFAPEPEPIRVPAPPALLPPVAPEGLVEPDPAA